jgi:hypothetical protein
MTEAFLTPPSDPDLLIAWLERAPAHVAAAWVSSKRGNGLSLFPENTLKILRARSDPFLDLALALYGDDDKVLRKLWVTNEPAIRSAIILLPVSEGLERREGRGCLDLGGQP